MERKITLKNIDRRIKELAKEYEQKGYSVVTNPSQSQLPDFLKGFEPDLIVSNIEETVVIEVRTRQNSDDLVRFEEFARKISERKGWRFELVVTNPQTSYIEKTTNEILDKKNILQRLEDIKKLCSLGFFEAACLLSWSTIEAAMRSKLTKEDVDESNKPTSYIIKTVYSYGLINLNDYKRLEKMYMIRNNITHGFNQFVTTKDIEELNDIVLYLIGEGFVYDMLNWVEGLDLDHYEDIYALYCTVNNKENYGLFSYEEHNNEILIRADHIDDELILISDEQRKRLANLIEEEYMGDMDPEGWYGYNRAMEKDD